ncbi:Myb-like DNA-binding domain containing protein [Trichomonas vaginalis G3]|uniref:Myb-like DNA-binding domain containing protein n=1 Tax=Trichomonas vaginalis (strain ATCC PRA-98 / G3) TaxID=412133 RepID=A2FT11_TRIV3|nr:RNA polymerase II transcription regulator recruiting protein [Trichomonas vaginalis G3]EAX91948.1 Myb-like DNA-binding domain containing protein [Trichomonas vaginalis G3]KAI5514334.1 RNA polymerase II transcription regulator recruiting protein [Trichomonas vaginalis G3]|eukprot:XP_001304878.1 Myb-like DNA-binding domain containing protein [Trichomonas vaginalis G3]
MTSPDVLHCYEQVMVGLQDEANEQLRNIIYKFIVNEIDLKDAKLSSISLTGNSNLIDKLQLFMRYNDDDEDPSSSSEDTSSKKKNKIWSLAEDHRLIIGIHRYGIKCWSLVSEYVGNGRTRCQCLQRWQRSLNPIINKNHWAQKEDIALLNAVQKYGDHSWTKVSNEVKGRTDIQCRYRYQLITSKYPEALGLNPTTYICMNYDNQPPKAPERKKVEVAAHIDIEQIMFLKDISSDPTSLFNLCE